MKKLTPDEDLALHLLAKYDGYCPGRDAGTGDQNAFLTALKSLVRKKYAVVEETDDGPKFHAA
jgi:hypothetical protein